MIRLGRRVTWSSPLECGGYGQFALGSVRVVHAHRERRRQLGDFEDGFCRDDAKGGAGDHPADRQHDGIEHRDATGGGTGSSWVRLAAILSYSKATCRQSHAANETLRG